MTTRGNRDPLILACTAPNKGPSVREVVKNGSYVQYTCSAGYRVESGDFQRSCEANGTWSGTQPLCVVDSILPKAYLVILIVGATVAVFLACIPYDFYRFRKRKKKVRDHQERLSLVTRIAPGHAKVVSETVPADQIQTGHPQARRFGLKSLFSVFRFVGGKMRSAQGPGDALDQICLDEKNGESDTQPDRRSVSDSAQYSDGAIASPYVFSPQLTPSFPAAKDFLDFSSVNKDQDCDLVNSNPVEDIAIIDEDDDVRPRSSSPLVLDTGNSCNSVMAAKKAFLLFKKSNEILNSDIEPLPRQPIATICTNNSTGNKMLQSAYDPSASEPATMEVISVNKATSPESENPKSCTPTEEFPPASVASPASSTTSLDVASLKKADPKLEQFRMFHYPRSKNRLAYHSMPTISDIP